MQGRSALVTLLAVTAFAALLLWALRLQHEAATLRLRNAELQSAILHLERTDALITAEPPPAPHPAPAPTQQLEASHVRPLLDIHRHWDWKMMVSEMLTPFDYILQETLDAGVKTCFENGTMYCLRAQVVDNKLYITDYRAMCAGVQPHPGHLATSAGRGSTQSKYRGGCRDVAPASRRSFRA